MSVLSLPFISCIIIALGFFAAGYIVGRRSGLRTMASSEDGSGESAADVSLRVIELETEVGELSHDRIALATEVGELEQAHYVKTEEVEMLNEQLSGFEVMRVDYRELKFKSNETDRLRNELMRLETELRASHFDVTADEVRDARTAAQAAVSRDEGASLQEAMGALLTDSTWAAVIVDGGGLPIVSSGVADESLAAFSVFLADACERVSSYVSMGRPYMINLIDDNSARVSLWPFAVGEDQMSLVTLSKQPPPRASVDAAISDVRRLLSSSFRGLVR